MSRKKNTARASAPVQPGDCADYTAAELLADLAARDVPALDPATDVTLAQACAAMHCGRTAALAELRRRVEAGELVKVEVRGTKGARTAAWRRAAKA